MYRVVALLLGSLLVTSAAGQPFTLRSPDFRNGAPIPAIHAYQGNGCTGRNVAPTLAWAGVPARTRSFALVVVDPDAPKPGGWVHWVVYNVPATWRRLGARSPHAFDEGLTSFGTRGYGGPCPPTNGQVHHYVFTLYALNVAHLAGQALTRDALRRAMRGHILGTATLIGTFRRTA
jgi:Raf kinase inhibitor-like YbhB/YbcL family protein